MSSLLHVTNGDSAARLIQESGIGGDVLAWRDVLHEGPVPAGLSLDELSVVRAEFLAGEGLGHLEDLKRGFHERDDTLRRFADYDEVILWFEWDLYDQLQLIQLLDFFAVAAPHPSSDNTTSLSLVAPKGYLGNLPADDFPVLMDARAPVTAEMLELGRVAWEAFRSADPRDLHRIQKGNTSVLPFLGDALLRELEEFPSIDNGLSRSERQILEAVAQGPQNFSEIFRGVANREDRIFCGDSVLADYIQRVSDCKTPLITYQSGERIVAPRFDEDSRAFRNAEMGLTEAGQRVLSCEEDWIALGGSDRWLGGVHLAWGAATWRWDSDANALREIRMDARE